MDVLESTKSRIDDMKSYYGQTLSTAEDLQSNICTIEEKQTRLELDAYGEVHPEVTRKAYGCGAVLPACLDGVRVLDIGCGAGRDAFALARLVGPAGYVVGIDVTEEHIRFANEYIGWHMKTFGFDRPNVEFHHGAMEDLERIGLADDSFDVVVSNCVINLSAAKDQAFREILRVLKPGGELYFSDIFANRRLDPVLANDPVLVGECIGDVMYTNDFYAMIRGLGIGETRRVRTTEKEVRNPTFKCQIGDVTLTSDTYRLFNLPLEMKCEDYGQAAMYLGTIPGHPDAFVLDQGHIFQTKRAKLVCGNTARMLADTRYARHFAMLGDRKQHFGPFGVAEAKDESTGIASAAPPPRKAASACCG
ncbi:MAG: methyltransferase domain-containing protein [Paracoccus sp. (in: a-proteobacteria)]|nr:methyltransferase domain-containing protein [Paracoccus sp. (in: a-proteobacteria)]